jgi:hypothetical protein
MKYIVSTEHRFVYFVTPKVACSSIKEALLPLFSIDTDAYTVVGKDGRTRVRPHKAFDDAPFQLNKKAYLARESEFSDYLRFGFVRNPWDRLISCYRQKLQQRKSPDRNDNRPLQGSRSNPDAFYLGMPFEEFIEQVHAMPDSESDLHFKSQASIFYTPQPEERCLASTIGRFESLAADFATIIEQLGLTGRVTLGHRLRSRQPGKKPYTDFYDQRLRELVAERYADDIRLFGYDY